MKLLVRLADIPKGRRVALYGASSGGRQFYKVLNEFRRDLNVAGFIDTYKRGKFDGLPILDPSDLSGVDIVLICSCYWKEISSGIDKDMLSFTFVVPFRFLREDSSEKLRSAELDPNVNALFYPLVDKDTYIENRKHYEYVCGLLGSEEQKELYMALVCPYDKDEHRLNIIGNHYLARKSLRQYFEFINLNQIETIIEGGVYDGRDAMEFISKKQGEVKVYGFEPFTHHLQVGNFGEKLNKSGSFVLVEKGLWSSRETLKFSKNNFLSSVVGFSEISKNENDVDEIEAISIDEYVAGTDLKSVDFIKMDIEGSEIEALSGAVNSIRKFRPQLAISIYHRKEDYFEIPLFLNKHVNSYEYYLGHYTPDIYETVWYGIPKEKMCYDDDSARYGTHTRNQ